MEDGRWCWIQIQRAKPSRVALSTSLLSISAVLSFLVDGDDSKRMTSSRSMSIQTTTSQLQQQRRPKFTPQEISAQLQQLHLFSSLSSSSNTDHIEQLGPILLNIHRSRQQDAYLKALKEFVAEKEAEIEAVCTRNYQVRNVALVWTRQRSIMADL